MTGPSIAPTLAFLNLEVPPELAAKLTRLAAEAGRTVDQVALDLVERLLRLSERLVSISR